MNITFHSIASQSVSLFKEKIVPVLTTQRERIAVVVAFALGCLALSLLHRCVKALFFASTVTTWNFRKNPTNEEPQEIPAEYAWVTGKTVEEFLGENPSLDILSAVAKSAVIASENGSLLIRDLVIHVTDSEQMQAIVTAVANDKDKVRAIFSALFAMSDDQLLVGERVQLVANRLSPDQLKNVLALAERHRKDSDFYQQEIHEITVQIEIDKYLKYRSVFLDEEFVVHLEKLQKYYNYAAAQVSKQAQQLSAKK